MIRIQLYNKSVLYTHNNIESSKNVHYYLTMLVCSRFDIMTLLPAIFDHIIGRRTNYIGGNEQIIKLLTCFNTNYLSPTS